MDLSSVRHESDSRFSYCLGGTRFRLIVETKKNDDILSIVCLWNSYCHLYQIQLEAPLTKICSDHLHDFYSCEIDNGDPAYAYVFRFVNRQGKVSFFSGSGWSDTYDFSRAFLDEFMATYPNPSDTVRESKAFEGRLFYQIFPERFARGAKEPKAPYINEEWGTSHPNNLKFEGGDFQGIKEKLPYLSSLGVGAIYLTPIHPSPSAHKYDVNDYFDIDPMFGTKDDFVSLVKQAHALDIKIVMDLVFNHACYYGNLFQDVVKNGRKSPYFDWFFVDGEKPNFEKRNYLTFAEVPIMPKLNTNNPAVQEYLCKVGEYWIKEADVDGYRLDVAFEVSHEFWRLFRRRVRAAKSDFILIGEDWVDCGSRLEGDEWDSVMNYPFRLALERFFVLGKSTDWLSDELNGLLMRYREATNSMMLNLLDSHDIARFYNFLGFSKRKLLMAYAITVFYPGLPEVYQGDEIFMEGENDPYNRMGMRWNSPEFSSPEGLAFKKILSLRKDALLRKGSYAISSQDGVLFLKRSLNGESLLLSLCLKPSQRLIPEGTVILSQGITEKGTLGENSFAVTKL